MSDYVILEPDSGLEPMVSIFCPVYNQEAYLRDCLDGILMQEVNFPYEIVVHDDASTDSSVEILKEYRSKYPDKFKLLLQKENQYSQGKHIAVEFIFPNLRGKYVAICEGDDFWTDTTKLQKQIDFLEAHQEYSACVHNCIKWNLRDDKKEIMYACDMDYDIRFEQAVQSGSSCYQTASLVFRRVFLEDLPKFFTMVTSYFDYTLAIRLALAGKIRFFNEVMSTYRFFSSGSLAESSIHELTDVKCRKYEATRNMLKEVDRYSEYQYHECIEKLVENYEYDIAEYKNDYKTLSKEPFAARFKSKGLRHRIKVCLKHYLGGIYDIYKKVRY